MAGNDVVAAAVGGNGVMSSAGERGRDVPSPVRTGRSTVTAKKRTAVIYEGSTTAVPGHYGRAGGGTDT